MAPAAKRARTKAITYPCHTCLEDRTTGAFPDYNPTVTCDHLINTCKRCLKQWIESQIETSVFTPHIQCPQCDQKMSSMDVEMALPKKMAAAVPIFAPSAEPLPIFLNRHGGTYLGGDDDAASNRSSIVRGASADVGPFSATDGEWQEVLGCVQDLFSAFNVVVTDVVMPTMDGPTMVRHVRERYPDLPVLFMSGYAEEQLRNSIDIDNVAFLPKPFSVQQLADATREVLAGA